MNLNKYKYKLINLETGKVIGYYRMKTTAVQEQKRIEREYFGLKTKLEVIG
ncbi:MAG: hypothetical protein ACOC56_05375 [Atribacterota bacterium]